MKTIAAQTLDELKALLNDDGDLIVDGNLAVGTFEMPYPSPIRNVNITGDSRVATDWHVRGYQDVRGTSTIRCDKIYPHLSVPNITGTLTCTRVVPAEWQRRHWSQRLGVELNAGDCYDAIGKKLADRLPEWLSQTHWLPVERMILESYAAWLRGEKYVCEPLKVGQE